MQLIRGLHNLRPEHAGCVLTIGNFDGVHLGHQAVLQQLKQQAHALGVPACVMLFEPQPLELFIQHQAPARLTRLREKYLALARLGIDRLLCVRFHHAFAQLQPELFIEQILVQQLGVRFLIVGDDFRFGRQRRGDFALLQQAGRRHGFAVVSTQSFCVDAQRVSSTLVREALGEGNLTQVQRMLGEPYTLSGRVAHGDKLGRTIGFPTANVHLKRRRVPVSGVYAVEVLFSGQLHHGVANVGVRPTVHGTRPQLEVHLFDFAGNLYGRQIQVRLCHKLRDEQKFESFAALQQQIERDAQVARAFFGLGSSTQQ
ncbi:MAG: bifunctional riboflavin kinase/FAD synthetase [Aeromonadaceae bacterium]|nr:bifunctional riboflavin kinase/FAD synthetase [Aeromonadaceae bacterium]